MKKFMISFILFFLISLTPIKTFSQEIEIEIDSTFKSSFEIFPFNQNDKIGGINVEGNVYLNSDTSLVRLILVDDDGFQYMIFETYSLICPNLYITFNKHCDETCFLDQVNPNSIIIQVIDATLNLKNFYYTTDSKENASEERFKAKRSLDAEKIETLNRMIPEYNMDWVAGDNSIVAMYYDQKRKMFGDGYDLRGFEYYLDGVFELLGHRNYPRVNPDVVRQFDWRDRHGANIPNTPYWDGDTTYRTGWLTSVKYQGASPSCWAFAAVGATEAAANLFTTHHLDLDLSEQQVYSCGDGGINGDICSGLLYIKNHGVVTEDCCPYTDTNPGCNDIDICQNPVFIISIKDTNSVEYNQDSIRIDLINKGPQPMGFTYPNVGGHAVVISGFEFDPKDSTLIWIFKNSWGASNTGFEKMKIDQLGAVAIKTPIYNKDIALSDTCRDEDLDGYYFWGIGKKPQDCNCSNDEDCDDNNKYVGGYDENFNCRCIFEMDAQNHYILSDTTWTDSTYVNYVIIVDSGAVFTISTYVAFAPEAKIIVKPGSELVIDGGYLTKICPDLWRGIEIWGNPNACQLKANQGTVTVKNESIIEYADTAIFTGRIAYNVRAEDYAGGLISCENSIFRDNVYDVIFLPYHNFVPGQLMEYPNWSRFTKVNFLTTENLYFYTSPVAHIKMTEVYGIILSGCGFENKLTQKNEPYYDRGIGIYSLDAHFFLQQHCNNPQVNPCNDLTPCKFTSLEYGLKAINHLSRRTLDIREVEFYLNIVGVSLSGINDAAVLSNTFTCKKINKTENDDRFIGGLFIENCSGYHVEANIFQPPLVENDTALGVRYGLGVKNSGPENNEIYRNKFSKMDIGIICMGENRGRESGLCLKCNTMEFNKNDFIVEKEIVPPLGIQQGIAYYQGNPNDTISFTAPAGNTFTLYNQPADTNVNLYWNYFNTGENIWYVHHQRQLNPLTYPYDDNYTQATIELDAQPIIFNKSLACPSRIEEENYKSYADPRLKIQDADSYISLYITELNSLVDGGNTDALNLDVMTSQPEEALEIRQQLLSDSPYLSDTILKQAIYKEDVLPNAMVRDIMEANPHSAKTEAVLSTLDDREEPMPDYMRAQIMNGKEYLGAKELLEAQIQYWHQVRAMAKSELFRQFLLDTNIVNPFDSIIAFLESENDLQSNYDLVFAYWNNLDTASAMLTLNNIPLVFELNEFQTAEHQQYENYLNILRQLTDNNLRASELDSSDISKLFDLMESDNTDISARSRGLLVKGGFYNYLERVILPHYSNSNLQYYRTKINPAVTLAKDNLRLFPNPAGDYVIAYYDIEDTGGVGQIIIHDVKGAILNKYAINPGENQMVINLKDLPNGLYIVSLVNNFHLLESKKLNKGAY